MAQAALSAYDRGRFWHLRGVAAWRLDNALSRATHALNRSIALLEGVKTLPAQTYLGRVFDTFGQLAQHQGLLREARREFERALVYKRAGKDRYGLALTAGNLGRLCMELGDFAAAARYLRHDFHLLAASSEPEAVRLRLQVLSHLGTCALELSKRHTGQAQQEKLQEARDAFVQSAKLAHAIAAPEGLAFAALGLGKVALLEADLAEAQRQARAARRSWRQADLPPLFKEGLHGFIRQLTAEIHLAAGRSRQALQHFQDAHTSCLRCPNVSPIEMAQLLYGFAKACLALGQERQAVTWLRQALQRLDATEAEQFRAQLETEVRQHFREAWLLHTTGRFLGQQHLAFLLEHAGRDGFHGATQDVVILFTDIRDFTRLSEGFATQPQALITFLNAYLSHMTRCVERYGGMIDKFIGDAVMAVFSLPVPRPAADAEQAVLAALMMREELAWFNRTLPTGTPPLTIGIGLHAGPVVAGLIGSPQKRSYTVIGDAVNTASRLEGLTKHLGASILISEEVAQRLPHPDRFLLRPLGCYRLKGKATPVRVADVVGEDDRSSVVQPLKEEIARVDQALQRLQAGEFATASDDFTSLAAHVGQAPHARGYEFRAPGQDIRRTVIRLLGWRHRYGGKIGSGPLEQRDLPGRPRGSPYKSWRIGPWRASLGVGSQCFSRRMTPRLFLSETGTDVPSLQALQARSFDAPCCTAAPPLSSGATNLDVTWAASQGALHGRRACSPDPGALSLSHRVCS